MIPEPSQDEVRRLLERRDWERLASSLGGWPAADVAELLLELDKPERVLVFRALPRRLSDEAFAYLGRRNQDALLRELADEETRALLANLRPDDRTALLEELPARVTRRLMSLLSPEDLEEARTLLGYPEESAGRLMTPDHVALRPEWTAGEALEHVRAVGAKSETISHLYVTDDEDRLQGELKIERLVLAQKSQPIGELSNNAVSLSAFADQEEAVALIKRYDLYALPVVDSDGLLLGIVTVDDIIDVAEEETTEDIRKQAGETAPGDTMTDDTTADDGMLSDEVARSEAILESSFFKTLKLRLPWLIVALVGGLMAGLVINVFEETLEAVVALAFFVPVIMDMGGNVGTQASTIFVRGLAVGHIAQGNVKSHLVREVGLGLLIGIIVGLLAGLAAFLWQGMLELALVVALSLVGVCTVASFLGYVVPWLVKRVGFDPAAVSAPFITTLKDVTALIIYFALASALMGALL